MNRRARVTEHDLATAAEWLETYEAPDGDPGGTQAACRRVAAWLAAWLDAEPSTPRSAEPPASTASSPPASGPPFALGGIDKRRVNPHTVLMTTNSTPARPATYRPFTLTLATATATATALRDYQDALEPSAALLPAHAAAGTLADNLDWLIAHLDWPTPGHQATIWLDRLDARTTARALKHAIALARNTRPDDTVHLTTLLNAAAYLSETLA